MQQALNKVFVQAFYKANAGFFLFFFFVFFGAVQGGSLLSYHLSLIKSILGSTTILGLVLLFWTAYHIKCTAFFLRVINSEEGRFLYNVQSLHKGRQWLTYTRLYTAVYSPVLVYAVVVAVVGAQKGHVLAPVLILLYQVLSLAVFAGVIYYRMNHWMERFRFPSFSLPVRKTYLLYVFFYFFVEKKNVLLLVKALSVLLLYIALVWNGGPFHNGDFILFYLLILTAHAALPYLSVRFTERRLAIARNLPLPLFKRGVALLFPYCLLVLPEALYLFLVPNAMPTFSKVAYVVNLPASMTLLSAVQYSEAQARDEYLKVIGGLLFVTIFILHVQAFWVWIAVQFIMAAILFASGYYTFEAAE